MTVPILEMRQIGKRFPGVIALDSVNSPGKMERENRH
jgi:ABC-type sugar transport system ATPase subunit